jgi:hypothetical protein
MATSANTADGGPSADPLPQQEMLATVAAQVAAIDTLLGLARHSIRVFDVDLSGMGWNGAARAATITGLLRSNPAAKVEIIVHDTGWIERSCPRLLNILGSAVTPCDRRTGPDTKAMDPLLFVRRPFPASLSPRAARALSIGDLVAAQPLVLFGAISSAEPGVRGNSRALNARQHASLWCAAQSLNSG